MALVRCEVVEQRPLLSLRFELVDLRSILVVGKFDKFDIGLVLGRCVGSLVGMLKLLGRK